MLKLAVVEQLFTRRNILFAGVPAREIQLLVQNGARVTLPEAPPLFIQACAEVDHQKFAQFWALLAGALADDPTRKYLHSDVWNAEELF
jgi:hypothetical protein